MTIFNMYSVKVVIKVTISSLKTKKQKSSLE